jgi:hypothetical protein
MSIPEWQIEEALAWHPSILQLSGNLTLIERQKYLKNVGRYIDLLFKDGNKYILVEVKSTYVDDENIAINQVLDYRKELTHELSIPESAVLCILASPMGFSRNVISLCNKEGIIAKILDEERIIEAWPNNSSRSALIEANKERTYSRILNQRGVKIDPNQLSGSDSKFHDVFTDEIKSVRTWIRYGIHDDFAMRNIAKLFRNISDSAPICAHEVGTGTDGRLKSIDDMWFWLFYSVLDRRANASLFIKARKILEKKEIYRPERINRLVKEKSYETVVLMITRILSKSGFPLIVDSKVKEQSFPKSIVDAAKFMQKHRYNFDLLYKTHVERAKGNLDVAFDSLWKDVKENIYGVGPRIASQFIRGMVLKGPWVLPLNDNRLLEKCRFNVGFAGKMRLRLIDGEENFYDLGNFADKYLEGNRAIISHVLWYIRKRYCSPRSNCKDCAAAGYCWYSLKNLVR